jgi:hypothetical protein
LYKVRTTAQKMITFRHYSKPACRSRLQTTSNCAGEEPG